MVELMRRRQMVKLFTQSKGDSLAFDVRFG